MRRVPRGSGIYFERYNGHLEGSLEIAFQLSEHASQLRAHADKYSDQKPDLADLCIVRMSELNPHLAVVTMDRDFLIYRRNGNESIPVIMPPGF